MITVTLTDDRRKTTLQEEHFHRNLNFVISPMANPLNLNPTYFFYFFTNLPMIAYIIEI